ncbi:hypothetical protein ACLOAV_009912 [Pseudogymnoascus australis]
MSSTAGDSIRGGYTGNSKAVLVTLGTVIGITWYICLELLALIFITFERYKGLYFWSLLISTVIGVLLHSVGYLLKYFNLTTAMWLPITITTVGWWAMITGQSFVLYSRLNLVLRNQLVLRLVLFMILMNIFLLIIPTTVLTYASSFSSSNTYVAAYNVMERIEILGFSIQEIIISTLYIRETNDMLKLNPEGKNRKIVLQLFGINLVFILMDLGLIAMEFAHFNMYQTTIKGLVYSIKLKLEFAVLGQLVYIVDRKPEFNCSGPSDLTDFVDASRLTSDITHATALVHNNPHPPHIHPEDNSIAVFEGLDRNPDNVLRHRAAHITERHTFPR